MAYQMKGNKEPGSSYKDQESFEGKGLTGVQNLSEPGEHSKEEMKLMEGTTILPTLNVSSDASSKIESKPAQKIHFDSSTDRGIETLYTGDREGEGSAFSMSKGKTRMSNPFENRMSTQIGQTSLQQSSRVPGRINTAQTFDFDETTLPEKKSPTKKVNVLTKKSGKKKVISENRAERVKSTIARRKSKGKKVKRSVKSYDISQPNSIWENVRARK